MLLNKTRLIVVKRISGHNFKIEKSFKDIKDTDLNILNTKIVFGRLFWVSNKLGKRRSYIIT